jgi:hypothetical protein
MNVNAIFHTLRQWLHQGLGDAPSPHHYAFDDDAAFAGFFSRYFLYF